MLNKIEEAALDESETANEVDARRNHNRIGGGSQFVSVSDALHPSRGMPARSSPVIAEKVQIDSVNCWGVVWDEAAVLPYNTDSTSNIRNHNNSKNSRLSPTAPTEVLISDPESLLSQTEITIPPPLNPAFIEIDTPVHNDSRSGRHGRQHSKQQSPIPTAGQQNKNAAALSHPCGKGLLLDIIIGSSLTLAACIASFLIELCTVFIYLLMCVFHWIAMQFSKIWVLGEPFRLIFLLVVVLLAMVDDLMLAISVLVTELIGAVAFILCVILGGPSIASEWHQYVRRVSHLTRWACRKFHENWVVKRGVEAYFQSLRQM